MPVRVHPATADRWGDLVTVFGRRGKNPSWCWCRLFLPQSTSASAANDPPLDNRAALQGEIAHASGPPGLIAYLDGTPVGWTRTGTLSGFLRLNTNKLLARLIPETSGV
jgi:hypothetical protein